MASNRCETFCRQVCAFVRFSPDHDAITAELTAHLEDHRDALLEARPDLTPEEAEEAAVLAMGDPVELGRALNESHSPLLGWFQIWFRRLVWGLAVLVLLLTLPQLGQLITNLTAPLQYDGHIENLLEHYEAFDVVSDDTPVAVGQYRDYDFSVPRAIVFRNSGSNTLTLRYLLKVSHPNPWQGRPEFMDWLWAEDDLGNTYPSEGQVVPYQFSDIHSGGSLTNSYFFVSYYGLWVDNIPLEATSVTLHFDRYGEDILYFTLPLKGGA